MNKQNIALACAIIALLGTLVNIWLTLEDNKHCTEFGKRVEAGRAEHIKKLGCVAIFPDGHMLVEPKP